MTGIQRGQSVLAAAAFVLASATAAAQQAGTSHSQAQPENLYQQALLFERNSNIATAIRLYRRAAKTGSGKAAKRLGEIYETGAPGIARNNGESASWYEKARSLGEPVDGGWGCPPRC